MKLHVNRREVLRRGSLVLLLGTQQIARGATVVAVRIWPAPEYSRVTIESEGRLASKQIVMTDPPRLAVDIEGLDLSAELRDLVAKVKADDPFIAGIRASQQSPGVVRMLIDLKQQAVPQVFTLMPVAAYKNRLVVDFYPVKEADPLEALIAERMQERPFAAPASPSPASPPADPLGELITQRLQRPRSGVVGNAEASLRQAAPQKTDRLIIIAIDPGHGGEDPGAVGPGGASIARAHQRRRGQRQPDARVPHPRRRFLRAAAHSRAKGAPRAGRPVREHPRRRVSHTHRAWGQCLRAE
jgi:N-acetylmuramoyl-L-alanine amidase